MTKKDFDNISRIILDHTSAEKERYVLKFYLVADLSRYFTSINPRFNRTAFIKACDPK